VQAEVTIVNSAEELMQAVGRGEEDIELTSHIDLTGRGNQAVATLTGFKTPRSIRV
jgi:hypothetical protein